MTVVQDLTVVSSAMRGTVVNCFTPPVKRFKNGEEQVKDVFQWNIAGCDPKTNAAKSSCA